MRRRQWFGQGLALLALSSTGLRLAHAQANAVPTVTRLVKIFLDLEGRLMQAQRDGDAAALGALLTDDFEQRSAPQPGVPVARAEWLGRAKREAAVQAGRIEQMAAHDHGSVVVVSFLVRPDSGTPRFIVDTWAKAGDSWKLAVRYSAAAG